MIINGQGALVGGPFPNIANPMIEKKSAAEFNVIVSEHIRHFPRVQGFVYTRQDDFQKTPLITLDYTHLNNDCRCLLAVGGSAMFLSCSPPGGLIPSSRPSPVTFEAEPSTADTLDFLLQFVVKKEGLCPLLYVPRPLLEN